MARQLNAQDIVKRWSPLVSERVSALPRAQNAASLLLEAQHLVNWLQAVRNKAVIEAIDQGVAGTEVAQKTGLTKSMISRIQGDRLRNSLPGGPDDIYAQIERARGGPVGYVRDL